MLLLGNAITEREEKASRAAEMVYTQQGGRLLNIKGTRAGVMLNQRAERKKI